MFQFLLILQILFIIRDPFFYYFILQIVLSICQSVFLLWFFIRSKWKLVLICFCLLQLIFLHFLIFFLVFLNSSVLSHFFKINFRLRQLNRAIYSWLNIFYICSQVSSWKVPSKLSLTHWRSRLRFEFLKFSILTFLMCIEANWE